MMDFTTMPASELTSRLAALTVTMLDVEEGKLKVDDARVKSMNTRFNAMLDAVEARGLQDDLIRAYPAHLTARLKKRGMK